MKRVVEPSVEECLKDSLHYVREVEMQEVALSPYTEVKVIYRFPSIRGSQVGDQFIKILAEVLRCGG